MINQGNDLITSLNNNIFSVLKDTKYSSYDLNLLFPSCTHLYKLDIYYEYDYSYLNSSLIIDINSDKDSTRKDILNIIEAKRKAFDSKNYSFLSILSEKSNRKDLFIYLFDKKDDLDIDLDELYSIFLSIHKSSEYGFEDKEYRRTISNFLSLYKKEKNISYKSKTLYRGLSDKSDTKGICFTQEREMAEWFSNRFNNPYQVIEVDVPSHYIIHIFEDDDESEVIVSEEIYKESHLIKVL